MNKYQLLQKVGSGNFSSVHLVRNLENGQTAAMKIMKTHQNIGLKQAYFLKNFDHPNIVRLLDFEQDTVKGETKIVLEYLPENTLELYQQQQFGLRQEQVKCILFQAALGLAYVHEKGIIHRDIKPQNILIDKRKAQIKLIDFGLAVSLQKVATDYVATRWYRAPQNLLGTKQYSCLIDVFSLACVIVELYLGNPLFPGADNIDQLYRIFNILGEPNEVNWVTGYKKFKQMGFKNDSQRNISKKNEENFGLRTLLKACSPNLVNLLQKMLALNPKKRITTKEIVVDPYFSDVKTIIPPSIYKRFQKDHIFRKTTSKQIIQTAQNFINSTRSKLTKENQDDKNITNLITNRQQENNYNNLIHFNVSPRKHSVIDQQIKSKQNELKKVIIHGTSPKHINTVSKNNNFDSGNILAFRGFNPIKNNKVSVKQTRKFQQNHSQNKSHRDSRDNSIDSAKGGKQKLISNSIDLGKKLLNSTKLGDQIVRIERRITNERQYRTPDIKNKSLDKQTGKTLYYFQGENDKGKAISPLKIIMPSRNQPIESRIQSKNNSFILAQSARITRNNSAINLPSVRIQPSQQIRSVIQPRQRQRISHSPGINVTQIQRQKVPNKINLNQKESIYVTRNNVPTYEKLKIITNVVPAPHNPTKNRNDKSFDHNQNISAFQSAQTSIIQPRQERTLEFKQKIITQQKPFVSPNQPHKIYHFDPNIDKSSNTPSSKLKPYKSVQHREIVENTKYFANPNQGKRDNFGQFKTIQIDDRKDYRQPRIGTKKLEVGKLNQSNNFSQMLSSPRQNNININLNVSIIEGQGKPEVSSIKQKRNRL